MNTGRWPQGQPLTKNSFIILGYGKFGTLAHQRIAQAFKLARFTIVDKAGSKIQGMISESGEFIQEDAGEYLVRQLNCSGNPTVVPMTPFHLAADVFLKANANLRKARLEINSDTLPPNWVKIDECNGYCSWATFMCPDNCPEGYLCSVTKKPRKEPMHELLGKTILFGRPIRVIKSEQILPGVGGYKMKELEKALLEAPKGKFALATGCKCHAIVTGIENPS